MMDIDTIPLIGSNDSWVTITHALGAIATVTSLYFIYSSAKSTSQSLNITILMEIKRQLAHRRSIAHEHQLYEMSNTDFYVFDMIEILGNAAFLAKPGLMNRSSRAALKSWLQQEIESMEQQPVFKQQLDNLSPDELLDLQQLRFNNKLTHASHWEHITGHSNLRERMKHVSNETQRLSNYKTNEVREGTE